MQFKNPEILYFLALVIIPILVHLFQLQRFVKTPFTNVAFLQKLVVQTRKSSRLKKWLILTTRCILLSAIVFAFSQPYLSSKKHNKTVSNFIYLDNSLSTSAKGERGILLQSTIQELIENISENDQYTLQTNTAYYENLSATAVKKILIQVKNQAKNSILDDVFLKISDKNKTSTKTSNKTILISDLQNTYKEKFTNVTHSFSLIPLKNNQKSNVSIDSVFVSEDNANNFTIHVVIKNQGVGKKNLPIAFSNSEKLIGKQSFSIAENSSDTLSFSTPKRKELHGKIEITYSDTFIFDNTFYFTLNSHKKINILSIGKPSKFLSRIYTKSEFNYTANTIQKIDYNSIDKQQLILLNEVEEIPQNLQKSLAGFMKKGGHVVVIPHANANLSSYNTFFNRLQIGQIAPKRKDTLKITQIQYENPFFKNVFSKKNTNFQYPSVQTYFPSRFKGKSNLISLQNTTGFIQMIPYEQSSLYWIASPLSSPYSNFTSSPLVVPTFYNFGKYSSQHTNLYYTIDQPNTIDIQTQLKKDEILTIQNNQGSFIPLQQTFYNKVSLYTKEQPLQAGFYHILKDQDTISTIAFNNPKQESILQFLDPTTLQDQKNITIAKSSKDFFREINKKNKVHWLWKWFLTLAIVSLLLEILILKFFKP